MVTSFTSIEDILEGRYVDEEVEIRGWVYRKREGKNLIFIVVRDVTGIIQCVVRRGGPAWANAEKVTIESSVALTGTVKKDERAPGGHEIST
ncbi:asparagine--tRNA ligase, partial [Candidatus Bathyarchaeota archaeon]|nr:asparagine--tRNA ligase [Candidatus Bathyarchaeota archaeon]NIU80850.1 asparagine--tRNA ligase [Candidatus Bathyarchaeota archaeon]NIV67482.1 asparagine--tRNA ligase [Candidatus Bathyarchaeota archaeon]NIW16137.1 asparagine--tRNA ligase [Candidatus Bathyarchaeota archaeon]NIW34128.1 asparagine--tRNA ligase [Candidatus Bathyarchaeota archaeon]